MGSWVEVQRRIRAGTQYGLLTEDRVRRLSEIGMIWENVRDRAWDKYFTAAQAYRKEYGNLEVPARFVTADGLRLGAWIVNLRRERADGQNIRLTPERISALEELGMIWSSRNSLWERYYQACVEYRSKYGNLDVPQDYATESGLRLGYWLRKMRAIRAGKAKGAALTLEQIERLDSLGMIWEKHADRCWEDGFRHARDYAVLHGNLDVPALFVCTDGFRLGSWLTRQRTGKISPAHQKRLAALGMDFSKENSWEVRFALAKNYAETHGNLNIPGNYVADGIWLGKWLYDQKTARKGNVLSDGRIALLESIGMVWETQKDTAWSRRYDAVRQYFDLHHHLRIPAQTILADGKKIGNWLILQRRNRKQGKLTETQIAKLDAMGMDWGIIK